MVFRGTRKFKNPYFGSEPKNVHICILKPIFPQKPKLFYNNLCFSKDNVITQLSTTFQTKTPYKWSASRSYRIVWTYNRGFHEKSEFYVSMISMIDTYNKNFINMCLAAETVVVRNSYTHVHLQIKNTHTGWRKKKPRVWQPTKSRNFKLLLIPFTETNFNLSKMYSVTPNPRGLISAISQGNTLSP